DWIQTCALPISSLSGQYPCQFQVVLLRPLDKTAWRAGTSRSAAHGPHSLPITRPPFAPNLTRESDSRDVLVGIVRHFEPFEPVPDVKLYANEVCGRIIAAMPAVAELNQCGWSLVEDLERAIVLFG